MVKKKKKKKKKKKNKTRHVKQSLIFESMSITTLPIHLYYQVFRYETIFAQDDIADITVFHHVLVAQHFKSSLCALCVQLTQYTIFSETERNTVA